ncbi:MAG: YihY/virulence factor BrkB family protein [Solirubrobacteraceae bacterium]
MAERDDPEVGDRGVEAAAPDEVSELPRPAWGGVLRRTAKEFSADHLTDLAAALTYYGVLSIFPMLIVIVSVLGLLGHGVTQPLIANLGSVAPGPARTIFTSAIHNIQDRPGTAGVLFVVSLVGALWSASGYVAAFMRASNVVWDVPEGRPFYKTLPVRLGVTLITVILLTLAALAIVFTGSLAGRLGSVIGVGSSAVQIWDIAKWPVMIVFITIILAILYYAGPNVRQPGFRWVTPGGVFAVLGWIVASALFALYVANFSSYNKTYGTLASVIVFLVWLWITNIVILFGAELNAELERGRQIEGGQHPDQEPYLPLRDTKKA